jgi:DNA-binding NtrC family response regulator
MRAEKLAHEQRKELLEFFDIEKGGARESDMIFFDGEGQEKEEVSRGIEELFSIYSNYQKNREELFREFRLKREICWLFIEYFFTTCSIPLKEFMDSMERNIILRTLSRVQGKQREAARILGVKHTTLNEKIKKYKIRIRR